MTRPDDSVRWVRVWPSEAQPEFRIGRSGQDLIAEWVGFATLRSNRSGSQTEFQIVDGAADAMVAEKFHRGQVQGLLRHLKGGLTLHGAAVQLGHEGLLVMGGSGVGKSSLVAALCTRLGGHFIADDTTVIELGASNVTMIPVEAHHWLDAESASALGLGAASSRWKQPVLPLRVADGPVPLSAIVALSFDDMLAGPQMRRLTGGEVFHALSMSALRFIVDETDVALHDFDQLARLAARVPVYALNRPRGSLERDLATLMHTLTPSPLHERGVAR